MKTVFKRKNTNDGMLFFYVFLIPLLISCVIFCQEFSIFITLPLHLLILWSPLVLTTYSISIKKDMIQVQKLFFGFPYKKILMSFHSIHFEDEKIMFLHQNKKLEIESYSGDGYFFGDFPDCILVSDRKSNVVLGSNKEFSELAKLINAELS